MSRPLFKELKRRNVYKVGVAYLVLAWVVVQVSTVAVPALHLPEWINSAVFLFGAIGFPFALFFAWEFELTPDGLKRESEVAPEDSVAAHTGRKLDFVIIGLLLVALGYFIYESRFTSPSTEADVVTGVAMTESLQEVSNEPEGTSIAVLPFVNMSSDKEQEYFSDGISEEILNVLAQIPKLHVTSRSSAFFYKDTKVNISEIAAKLGVKHVLEGSVRKFGNRIRITAQLIEAESDAHIWSDSYDRELVDLFAIQDEISAAIVSALKTKLGLDVKVATRDMSKVTLDAHNEYLKGRFFIENRNQADLEKALAHFDNAIALAPEYALAWVGKARASLYLGEVSYGNVPQTIADALARSAIEQALLLDADLPEAHGVMGIIEAFSSNLEQAIIHYKKAIELNPNYASAYVWYGNTIVYQPKKSFELKHKAFRLSPMSMLANYNYAGELIRYGRLAEAKDVVEHMLSINSSHQFPFQALGAIHFAEGEYARGIIALETAIKLSPEHSALRIYAAKYLSNIKLGDKAASYLNGTFYEPFKPLFKGDVESYISQIRATFPSREKDDWGNWIRGFAELFAENYQDASKYFKLTNIESQPTTQIYSYQQSGDINEAKALLEKIKSQYSIEMDAGAQYVGSFARDPIEVWVMEIAYLEGDIDTAIANLKKAMQKHYIVDFDYQISPIYKNLKAHPDWPAIMAESNQRALVQRELYLKLVAEGDNTSP